MFFLHKISVLTVDTQGGGGGGREREGGGGGEGGEERGQLSYCAVGSAR